MKVSEEAQWKDNDDNNNSKNKYLLNTYYVSGTVAECLICITLFNLHNIPTK